MSRARLLFSTFSKLKTGLRFSPRCRINTVPTRYYNLALPCTVGFSLFTWLGLNKPLTAEDEIVDTIKHCVLFIQRTEYEKAEQLLHVALKQAQQIQHQLGITYIYDVMANLALEREQLDKAKKLFISVSQRLMGDGVPEDDARVVHISIKLARISHLKKEYSTAQLGYDWCLEKLDKLLNVNPTQDVKMLIAITEDWYGRLFLDCQQYEHGLKFMKNSLEKMQELEVEKEHIVTQLNDIGTVYEQLNRYDESIEYIKQAIELGKAIDMEDLGILYVNLGKVYIKKNMLSEARKNCGYGWKLGQQRKNNAIKEEADQCIREINQIS